MQVSLNQTKSDLDKQKLINKLRHERSDEDEHDEEDNDNNNNINMENNSKPFNQ
jgi:hypothetical protein